MFQQLLNLLRTDQDDEFNIKSQEVMVSAFSPHLIVFPGGYYDFGQRFWQAMGNHWCYQFGRVPGKYEVPNDFIRNGNLEIYSNFCNGDDFDQTKILEIIAGSKYIGFGQNKCDELMLKQLSDEHNGPVILTKMGNHNWSPEDLLVIGIKLNE